MAAQQRLHGAWGRRGRSGALPSGGSEGGPSAAVKARAQLGTGDWCAPSPQERSAEARWQRAGPKALRRWMLGSGGLPQAEEQLFCSSQGTLEWPEEGPASWKPRETCDQLPALTPWDWAARCGGRA